MSFVVNDPADFADEAAGNTVGLDEYQGAFGHALIVLSAFDRLLSG